MAVNPPQGARSTATRRHNNTHETGSGSGQSERREGSPLTPLIGRQPVQSAALWIHPGLTENGCWACVCRLELKSEIYRQPDRDETAASCM
ncbi:hypothetical protein AOLI_G00068040 [Acnodon oligacanthus]